MYASTKDLEAIAMNREPSTKVTLQNRIRSLIYPTIGILGLAYQLYLLSSMFRY